MTVGLADALFAALLFGMASVLQQLGAGRVPNAASSGVRLLPALLRQPEFAVGVGLDAVAFVLTGLAARRLPLVVLEGVLSFAVAVTALGAALVLHERLTRRSLRSILAMVIGLALLAATSPPESSGRIAVGAPVFLVAAIFLAVVVVRIDKTRDGHGAGVALAATSGFAFGGWAVVARFAPPGLTLILAGVVVIASGLTAFGAALRRVSATTAMAVCVTVETLLPASVGLAAGDQLRPGTGVWAILGCVMTLTAAVVIATSDSSRTDEVVYVAWTATHEVRLTRIPPAGPVTQWCSRLLHPGRPAPAYVCRVRAVGAPSR
jgi:drug/metabolite transporter (DMT)-like permease